MIFKSPLALDYWMLNLVYQIHCANPEMPPSQCWDTAMERVPKDMFIEHDEERIAKASEFTAMMHLHHCAVLLLRHDFWCNGYSGPGDFAWGVLADYLHMSRWFLKLYRRMYPYEDIGDVVAVLD